MRNIFTIAKRILHQLRHDPRYIVLSIAAPTIITYMLKVFVDTLPPIFPSERYMMPVAVYFVHFIAFILSMVILVQERTGGTLERMLINGVKKIEIILGYLFGYMGLVTLQTVIVLTEFVYLFDFEHTNEELALLFITMWLVSMASVSLGLLLSSFARHEAHIFPFVPIVAIPSVFLSGIIADFDKLPEWAQVIGQVTPLYYANNIILEIVESTYDLANYEFISNFLIIFVMTIVFLILTSFTMRDDT